MRKIGLRAALTLVVASAVTITAVFIHLSWDYTARRNIGDLVAQLNRQIVGTVYREFFSANYNVAWSTQESIRLMLAEGGIMATDNAALKGVMLSLLRSQPGLSWISVSEPEGGLMGYHRVGPKEIDALTLAQGELTTDVFDYDGDHLTFKQQIKAASDFRADQQPWYQEAVAQGDITASLQGTLPGQKVKTLFFAAPVMVHDQVMAVINCAISLDNLSMFLDGLEVGRSGTVIIISKNGEVVAAQSATMPTSMVNDNPMMTTLSTLAAHSDLIRALQQQLDTGDPDIKTLTDTREFVLSGQGAEKRYFINFSSLSFQGWIIATIIPGSDFLQSIDQNARILVAVVISLTLILAVLAALLGDRLISVPLTRLSHQLKHIETFDLARVQLFGSPLRELDTLSKAFSRMSIGLAAFQKYMPTALVRILIAKGIEPAPGGKQEHLTVLFSDIAGFTGISEAMGDNLVPLLSEYLDVASKAILDNNGTIDKFIGDAVMAFWGAPIANPYHAVDACRAALAFQARMKAERVVWAERGLPLLYTRIGINSGRMLVGNIGSVDRLDYTVMGDSVNIASRLEALNKLYQTEILIGPFTREEAGDAIVVRRLDHVAVYGRVNGIEIYELLGMTDTTPAETPQWVRAYESGLDCYAKRDWQTAQTYFSQVIHMRGSDRPSDLFIARCQALLASPPGDDWNHLVVLDSK